MVVHGRGFHMRHSAFKKAAPATLLAQMPQQANLIGMWDMTKLATSPRSHVPNQKDAGAATASLIGPGRRQFTQNTFWNNSGCTFTDYAASGWDGKGEATTLSASGGWNFGPVGVQGGATYLPDGTYTVGVNVRWTGTGSAQFNLGNANTTYSPRTAATSWARYTVTFAISGGVGYVIMGTPDNVSTASFEIMDFEIFAGSSDLGPVAVASHLYFLKRNSSAAFPTLSAGLVDMKQLNTNNFIQLPTSQALTAFSAMWCGSHVGADYQAPYSPVISLPDGGTFSSFTIGLGGSPLLLAGSSGGTPNGYLFDSQSRNNYVYVVTYDGTTVKCYVNGQLFFSTANTGFAYTLKNFCIGYLAGNYYSGMQFNNVALWKAALLTSEVVTATSAVTTASTAAGAALEPFRPLFFEGDSITAGSNATTGALNFAALTAQGTTTIVRAGNLAVGGSGIGSMTARAAALDAYLPASKNGKVYVLHVDIGANDLGASNSAATAASVLSYIQARQAAGWDKIVLGTVISRTSAGDGGAQFDIDRAAYNTTIKGWSYSWLSIADYAANANIGANGAANNTTYFSPDKTHPIDAGHAIMGGICKTAIVGLWGY